MKALNLIYRLKEGFGTPNRNIYSNVDKVELEDEHIVWYNSFIDYL